MISVAPEIRVLVVEDSKTQAEWLKLTLEKSGMKVICVDTLAACVSLARRESFSSIMLDLTLPDSTGIDTLMSLSAVVPTLPIIVLTAVEDEALGIESLKFGAEDFLLKGQTSPASLTKSIRYAIERKNQARAVRQVQRHTREIIERAQDAFVAIDLDGFILDWNRKAQTLFGWSRLEIIGESFLDRICACSDDSFSEELSRYKSNGCGPFMGGRSEISGRNKNGEVFPMELAFFPVQVEESFMLCSFITDLRSRKEVQQRMNEFYSVVSHELRSPVTSIRGALRLLESGAMGELNSEILEMLTISIGSCDRLIRLVSDLLDMSKIEAGAMNMVFEELLPEMLVENALNGIQGMAAESNIVLKTEISENRSLIGDRDKILQVLTNLVSNAIKFSPENSEVKLKAESGSSGTIKFSVSDKGPGISKQDMQRLFAKFQQLDNNSTVKAKGTGLGLAISKAIVSQHNGTIGVESEEGCGTTFWFELPVAS